MAAKLAHIELVPYSLPFREPYVTARGTLTERELLLVRIATGDGAQGLGEAAPLALRGGPGIAEIAAELRERCWPLLQGAEPGPGLLYGCRETGASQQALSAIDIAVHDLLGKLTGEPVWRLLGASRPRPVPCNATLPAAEAGPLAALAEAWARRGFETFKLKVGTERDRAQVRAVRNAVGESARIRIDANGVWSSARATESLTELEPLGIELVEQPAPGLEELAAVRRQTPIPVSADESLVTVEDARHAVSLEACDLGTVKLAKAGGILAGLEVAAELPVYLSSALDGPVGIAAAAHAAQALPEHGPLGRLAHGLATGELFGVTVATRQCELSGAELQVSEAPGLGVEIDEAELDRRRL